MSNNDESTDELTILRRYYTSDCKDNNVNRDYPKNEQIKYISQDLIYDVAVEMIEREQIATCYKFGDGPFGFSDNGGDEDYTFVYKPDCEIYQLDQAYSSQSFTKYLYLGSEKKGWYHALTVVTYCHA